MPKVSVIVPVYNVENYIERCVRSLMEQTLEDMEFIFVDDGSRDESINKLKLVLSHYSSKRYKIISNGKNRGVAFTRIHGLLESQGEYILYCDADDWMDKNMAEILYSEAVKKNADIVSCDFYMIYEDGTKNLIKVQDWSPDRTQRIEEYIFCPYAPFWNNLIKRSVFEDLDQQYKGALFRTISLGISMLEDFHMISRLLLCVECAHNIHMPLYYYDQTNTSSITKRSCGNNGKDSIKVILDLINFYNDKLINTKIIENLFIILYPYCQDKILEGDLELFKNTPKISKFIFKCRNISPRMKQLMWAASHRLYFIVYLYLFLKKMKK